MRRVLTDRDRLDWEKRVRVEQTDFLQVSERANCAEETLGRLEATIEVEYCYRMKWGPHCAIVVPRWIISPSHTFAQDKTIDVREDAR